MRASFHVFVSRRGNIFMTEIAELLAAAIADLGYDTVFPAPGLPASATGVVNLVVAPHEFFFLQPDKRDADLLRSASSCVCVGVEQPGTLWFDRTVHYASVARAVFDISHYAVKEYRRRGVEASHLQLGYHPSWDRWGGDPEHHRELDLLFLGSVTDRRMELLGDAAPLLWDLRCDLRVFEYPGPMSAPVGRFVAGTPKWDLLAGSRMLLNIHRNEVPYFEWVRALEAVCNGCLLLTEASADYGPLTPGEHLIAAPFDTLGALSASLAVDEPLRREITTAAYDYARTKLELTANLAPICDQLAADSFVPAASRRALSWSPPADTVSAGDAALLNDLTASEVRVRARIKELLDSETELVQALEALEAQLVHGDPRHAVVETTPAWDEVQPDISVVVTSYNYERFLGQAVESVVATEGTRPELIVVDDHSHDGSVELVRHFMAEHPWFPVRLVAKSANAGVGAARNAGFAAARAERVFVLDADNFVYPTALRKLSVALDADSEAAFAYGMIGRSGLPGLLSHIPWDIPRLLVNNYIDAMALIRRTVWVDVGGYDEGESSLRGWEDYEFWLRIAAAGGHGAFIPELIATYRVHAVSRQRTVDLDTESLHEQFRGRYPFLPWPRV